MGRKHQRDSMCKGQGVSVREACSDANLAQPPGAGTVQRGMGKAWAGRVQTGC